MDANKKNNAAMLSEKPELDMDLRRIKITKGALTVIGILQKEGYHADLVGGCVRDAMLGLTPKDEDITTNLDPMGVTDLFELKGYKVIPTGIEHGTVTIMIPDFKGNLEGYEVTTYRIDGVSSDQRHPDSVSFTNSIEEDMSRRDFTINAMAFDPLAIDEKRIKDFFNGRQDLKNGVIRTVGNPVDRIKEDALRMMRAVRFAAQKNMVVAKELKEAIKENAADIEKVSKERINAELTKIMESNKPAQGIADLHELGLLNYIAPDLDAEYDIIQNNPWHLYNVGKHTEKAVENTPNDKIIRFAVLFHDLGKTVTKTTDDKGIDHFHGHPVYSEKMARELMKELRFTNSEIKDICRLILYHDDRLEPDRERICRFIERHKDFSIELIDKMICVQEADNRGQNPEKTGNIDEQFDKIRKIFSEIKAGPCRLSDLALNGIDIQNIKVDDRGDTVILFGQDIKIAKDLLFSYILREPEKNNPVDLTEYLRSHLKEIKNLSIEQIDRAQEKYEARELYRIRRTLNKLERKAKKRKR